MRRKYKIIIGRHIEEGKMYKKDEVVISDKPLMQLFPQKFVDLGPADEEPTLPVPQAAATTLTDPPTKPALKRQGKGKGGDNWGDD